MYARRVIIEAFDEGDVKSYGFSHVGFILTGALYAGAMFHDCINFAGDVTLHKGVEIIAPLSLFRIVQYIFTTEPCFLGNKQGL